MNKGIDLIRILYWNLLTSFTNIFIKRDKTIIIIGAWMGTKFADNPRFLFQYLFDNKHKYGLNRVIWITRNENLCVELNELGYESYLCNSKESNYWHLKAGIHIICNSVTKNEQSGQEADIDTRFSRGAKCINLWHGIGGIKKVGEESKKNQIDSRNFFFALKSILKRIDLIKGIVNIFRAWPEEKIYFLTTTKSNTEQVKRFFVTQPQFIYTLPPRLCKCPRLLDAEENVLKFMKNYNGTILYLPTYRSSYTAKSTFNMSILGERLKGVIADYNYLLIQKSHSASAYETVNSFEGNILNLPPDFDINVLMPHITILITDYSSAATDARFLGKPVIFFVPDIDEYKYGDRGLTPEADELMSGPKYVNIEELCSSLPKYLSNPSDAIAENASEIVEKYCGKAKDLGQVWNDICETIK